MRGWIVFTLAFVLAAAVPTAAQVVSAQGTMPAVSVSAPSDIMNQGVFVSHTAATKSMPEMVTLRYDWQGTPLLGTFVVNKDQMWMANGQRVNWSSIQPGTVVNVPGNARLDRLSFNGGAVGVGKIEAMHPDGQNSITVRTPNGDTHILRYSSDAIVVKGNKPVPVSQLAVGDTVLFEIPPQGNQIALFTDVGNGRQANVLSVGAGTVTVRTFEGGKYQDRIYSTAQDMQFYQNGQQVLGPQFQTAFQPGNTVWIYGGVSKPQLVIGGVGQGFETAEVEQPQPGVVATAPAPPAPEEVVTPTAPSVTPVAALPAPFTQGTIESYIPATANTPAMVTMKFDTASGVPIYGTFPVTDESQWMTATGQPVNFAEATPGTVISVPASATIGRMTYGGPAAVGTLTGVNTNNQTFTVRLPNGQSRTLRYSPQAFVISNGQLVKPRDLALGDTILFEVPPQGNQVALFTQVAPGMPATISQIGPDTVTVSMLENGQLVTHSYPLGQNVSIYSNGQFVTASNAGTLLQPGQQVFVYGTPENPQLVSAGTQTGFETALVTPAVTPAVAPPVSAVAGVRQQPKPRHRVIRGRW